MLLSEAESKEQVAEALKAGDEELREDIEYELDRASKKTGSYEENTDDWHEEALWRVFEEIKTEFPPEAGDFLEKALKEEVRLGRGPHGSRSDFTLNERKGRRIGIDYAPNAMFYFPDTNLPENWEYIPDRFAKPFWAAVKQNIRGIEDWYEGDDFFGANSISVTGNDYDIRYEGDFDEYKSDLLREWASSLETSNPDLLIKMFLDRVLMTPEQQALVQEELARGKAFKKEAFDFAVQWAGADGSDAEETISEFLEWLEDLVEPEQEEREELLTITQADLGAMGIAKGTSFWDGAPWRLIKLLPGDLRREGRLMRHCVGDLSRGYTQAVKNGEIEI